MVELVVGLAGCSRCLLEPVPVVVWNSSERVVCLYIPLFRLQRMPFGACVCGSLELVGACGMFVYPAFSVTADAIIGFYSSSVGQHLCFASSCCVESKTRNSLKNRRKSLVSSDFIRTFARYLCVMRPCVRVLCVMQKG